MGTDYKGKLEEAKNKVVEQGKNIMSEENRQKLSEAAETAVKKGKGFKFTKKNITVIAVAVVAIIAVFAIFGGSEKREVKDIVEKYEDMISTDIKVSDVKIEHSEKVKSSNATRDNLFTTKFIIATAKVDYSDVFMGYADNEMPDKYEKVYLLVAKDKKSKDFEYDVESEASVQNSTEKEQAIEDFMKQIELIQST